MLEIIVLAFLCQANMDNALRRGRKPKPYAVLTVLLWLVFEVAGSIVGFGAGWSKPMVYLSALAGATLGGLIAYVIAKICKPGDYVQERMEPNFLQRYHHSFMKFYNINLADIPAEMPVTRKQKLAAIVNIVGGILLFLFPVALLVYDPTWHPVPFIIMACGLLPAGLGVLFVQTQRSKVKSYPVWMQLVNPVLAIFIGILSVTVWAVIIAVLLE